MMTLAKERGSSLTSTVELPFEELKRDAKAVVCSLGNRELEKISMKKKELRQHMKRSFRLVIYGYSPKLQT